MNDKSADAKSAKKRKDGKSKEKPVRGKAAGAAGARVDPTDAVAPEGMEDAPAVDVNGVHCDLDDLDLPKQIEKRAFTSGGYPYEDKLSGKDYDAELVPLQIELLKLQAWAKKSGERVAIVLEGRDGAGKGGTIKTITEHLNPRSVRVVALSKPSAEEVGQWYFQRYARHLPGAGEIVLFDRSWYNRAVVEPVMKFSDEAATARFLDEAPRFEKLLVEDGVRLFKIWLTVGREMQIKRLHDRRHDPLKRWKLSPIDYRGLELWDEYSAAAERMLKATHATDTPWTVVKANDKKRLRLAVIRKLLTSIPYAGRDMSVVGEPDPRIVLDAAEFLTEGGES